MEKNLNPTYLSWWSLLIDMQVLMRSWPLLVPPREVTTAWPEYWEEQKAEDWGCNTTAGDDATPNQLTRSRTATPASCNLYLSLHDTRPLPTPTAAQYRNFGPCHAYQPAVDKIIMHLINVSVPLSYLILYGKAWWRNDPPGRVLKLFIYSMSGEGFIYSSQYTCIRQITLRALPCSC